METTPQIESHLTANSKLRKRDIMFANFLGGLAWGVGSVLGATLVVALLLSVLKTINFVPLVGNIANQVINQVNTQSLPNTHRQP